VKPVASVYIDGFNLYHRALADTSYRWLDVRAMCEQVLANFEIGNIKYFTALVKPPPHDPAVRQRQQVYLEALRSHCNVEVHLGHFRRDPRWMEVHPARKDSQGRPVMARVRKTEEKGSDVNLATHLVWDALHDASHAYVVVSNDSDLETPIRRLIKEKGVPVGIIFPVSTPSHSLIKTGAFVRHLRRGVLQNSLLPNPVMTAAGEKIFCPDGWG